MPLGETSSSVVEAADGDLYVESAGAGPRSLLVITPIGCRWLLEALPEALAEFFTIHILEVPGTARSAGAPASASVAGLSSAVGEVVAAIGGDGWVLFGHSMNGTLALAVSGSVLCHGVIAVGAPPRLPSDPEESQRYWDTKAEAARKNRAADIVARYEVATEDSERTRLRRAFDRLRGWYDMDLDTSALDAVELLDFAWVQAMVDSAAAVDWEVTLAAVKCPVFLALGAYDFLVPPTAWSDRRLPPSSTVEVFERSAHTPFYEQSTDFVAAVERWVATLP